jgi:hypothetical protein
MNIIVYISMKFRDISGKKDLENNNNINNSISNNNSNKYKVKFDNEFFIKCIKYLI